MNSTFIQNEDVFQQHVFSFSFFLPTSNMLSKKKKAQFYMSWTDSNICE